MITNNPIGYANPDEMRGKGCFTVAFQQNGHYSEPVYSAALALLPGEPVAILSKHDIDGFDINGGEIHPSTLFPKGTLRPENECPVYTSPTPHLSVDRDALLEEARAVLEQISLSGRIPNAATRSKWITVPARVFSRAQIVLSKLECSSHAKA
ncbi:hypothetical protein G6M02_07870 [Agrobacterium rhizogenes]|nr:hypothetical protein [Rhizobium rhizogenes]